VDYFEYAIQFYAASLDDPENWAPGFYVHFGEQLALLNMIDD